MPVSTLILGPGKPGTVCRETAKAGGGSEIEFLEMFSPPDKEIIDDAFREHLRGQGRLA